MFKVRTKLKKTRGDKAREAAELERLREIAKLGGAPEVAVDLDLLRSLARIQCTLDEMSAIIGVSRDTLSSRFADIIHEESRKGKMSLRRAQYRKAIEHLDTPMLMWLGKHVLGQVDKKDEEVRTAADEILSYIKGRVHGEEHNLYKNRIPRGEAKPEEIECQ